MYFTNIMNEELQYFKGQYIQNFSISLTEALTSSLFIVEEIVTDTIYKLYPLFNVKNIYSSYNEDKILSNKCIIVTRQDDHETYFRFISNDNEVVAYNELFEYYTIDDRLTVGEFNSIVYQLRSNYPFTENININNSHVNGEYGEYIFNLESTTIVDNGVLITRETKDNIGTVRLVNPIFKYSTYTLILKVYTVEDINIDLANKNNIEVTTLELELETDTDVRIPFDTLDLNNIVGFDATVNIVHNKPVIQYPLTLTLSASSYNPVLDKITVLTCRYLDETGDPIPNELITFKSNDGTVLGTGTTDNEGYASFNYTPTSPGQILVYCVDNYNNMSSNITLNRILQSSSISLETDKSLVYIPDSFTVTGELIIDSDPASNTEINLYDNNVLIDTLTTDSQGMFSKTITDNTIVTHNLQVKYDGSDYINGSESSYVNITCRKYNTNITINTDKSLVYSGNSINVTGKLTNELNEAISGAAVKLMNGNTQLDTATTDSNGNYSFNKQLAIGNYNLTVVYAGDGSHESITSASKTVTCRKYNTNITINTDKSTVYYSQSVVISGKLTNEVGNAISGATVKLYNGNSQIATTTTGSNGTYSFTRIWSEGNYQFKVVYDGDASKNSVTSSVKSVTMSKAPTNTTIYIDSATGTKLGLKIKVSSNYGSFNPSSVDITYNGRTETVTTKDNEGNFIYTTPPVPEGTYNIIAKYNGTSQYTTSTASEPVGFTIPSDTVLTASYSNGTFTINAKYNGENMPYWMFNGMVLHLSNPQTTMTIDGAGATTDANGNITIPASLGNYHGTAYATYKSLTSNTTSY